VDHEYECSSVQPTAVKGAQTAATSKGSVADRRKIHSASMLYPIQNGSAPKISGRPNWPLMILWTNSTPFYPPMILFDNIVQVGASADLDGIVESGN